MQIIFQKWVQFQLTLFPLHTLECIVRLASTPPRIHLQTTECESFNFLIIVHCNINFQLRAHSIHSVRWQCVAASKFVVIYISVVCIHVTVISISHCKRLQHSHTHRCIGRLHCVRLVFSWFIIHITNNNNCYELIARLKRSLIDVNLQRENSNLQMEFDGIFAFVAQSSVCNTSNEIYHSLRRKQNRSKRIFGKTFDFSARVGHCIGLVNRSVLFALESICFIAIVKTLPIPWSSRAIKRHCTSQWK